MVVASLPCLLPSAETSIAAAKSSCAEHHRCAAAEVRSVGTSEINLNLLAVDFKRRSSGAGHVACEGYRASRAKQGAQGPQGAAAYPAPGYVAQVTSQSGTAAATTSTSFVNVAGA